MVSEAVQRGVRPTHYVCPCCHLYLLAWDAPTGTLEMFHKVGLWSDIFTGQVRIVCQHCLGATEVVPERLVRLLYQRFGLGTPLPEPRRTAD